MYHSLWFCRYFLCPIHVPQPLAFPCTPALLPAASMCVSLPERYLWPLVSAPPAHVAGLKDEELTLCWKQLWTNDRWESVYEQPRPSSLRQDNLEAGILLWYLEISRGIKLPLPTVVTDFITHTLVVAFLPCSISVFLCRCFLRSPL